MSNNGPRKPTPFTNSYAQKQGLYYSLSAGTRAELGKKMTKEVSEREHVSGLRSLNTPHSRTALAGIAEEDESATSTSASAAAASPSIMELDEEQTAPNAGSASAAPRSTSPFRHRQ